MAIPTEGALEAVHLVSMRRLLSGSSAAATGSIRGKLDGAIGRITISNPTKLNAMVSPLFSSLAR